jgi:site-specific recombinase XerD
VAREGFTPSVDQWYSKRALEAEGSADVYRSNLGSYWSKSVKTQGFRTIDEWVEQVRQQQKSDDVNLRRKWAFELEAFVNAYVSPTTRRPLGVSAKNVLVSSVTSYLKHCLGDHLESYDFTLGTKAERMAELREKESVTPVTLDEIKALYKEAKNKRDRAILSTLLSGGCGVAEWIQFNEEWFRYANDIRSNKVPIKINVTRPKTQQSYTHFLWDDAVEDAKDLLEEREHKLGRQLTAKDPLFANQSGLPIKDRDVQKTIRRLAHRSGAEVKDKSKVSYRIRPHEIGKDFFRTQLAIARVDNDVAEYLSGHVVDENAYNKFHKTTEGQALIEKQAGKLRPLLNIRTGRGRAETDKDTRLIAAEELLKSVFPDLWEKYEIKARTMTVEEALSYIRETIKERAVPTNAPYEYQRIPEDKADNHLNHGWDFVQVLPSGQLLVRRIKKD